MTYKRWHLQSCSVSCEGDPFIFLAGPDTSQVMGIGATILFLL